MLRPTNKDSLGALEISIIADDEVENTGNLDYQSESYDSDGRKYELSSYHQRSQVLFNPMHEAIDNQVNATYAKSVGSP